MNVNDSEVILSILQDAGYALTETIEEADVILANTCSIRDNAEQRIWGRIDQFKIQKRNRRHTSGPSSGGSWHWICGTG